MYLEHFGLAEPPFRITPHTDFFFAGANRGATLEALLYAITHDEGIVKVSGEVGSGKTMLCRVLMERLPDNVTTIFLANPALSRDEILHAIADELQLTLPEGRPGALLRALQERLIALYGEGKQVVALIDEAHAMPPDTLEQIRLLSNLESSRHKLLQIVLFGQPELDACLERPEMRQLKDRITHHFQLEPLRRADIGEYVDFRLRAAGYRGPALFSPAALKRLARASQGLTRRINILADKSLLAVFAENGHQVLPRHVHAAARDSRFSGSRPHPAWQWAAGTAVALVVALGVAWQSPPDQDVADRTGAPVAPAAAAPPPVIAAGASASSAADAPTTSGSARSMTQERIEATKRWLESVSGERWSLHLLTSDAGGADFVENYLRRNARLVDVQQMHAFRSEANGTPRINLVYGDYASLAEAKAALAQLPPPLRAYGPYPRQIKHLR